MATTVEEMAQRLGRTVERLRTERGWSRERLGPGMTGLSAATIQRIERGRKRNGTVEWVMPDGETLVRLANAFEVELPALFSDSDTPGYPIRVALSPHPISQAA